jgi:hypothetical protein
VKVKVAWSWNFEFSLSTSWMPVLYPWPAQIEGKVSCLKRTTNDSRGRRQPQYGVSDLFLGYSYGTAKVFEPVPNPLKSK